MDIRRVEKKTSSALNKSKMKVSELESSLISKKAEYTLNSQRIVALKDKEREVGSSFVHLFSFLLCKYSPVSFYFTIQVATLPRPGGGSAAAPRGSSVEEERHDKEGIRPAQEERHRAAEEERRLADEERRHTQKEERERRFAPPEVLVCECWSMSSFFPEYCVFSRNLTTKLLSYWRTYRR